MITLICLILAGCFQILWLVVKVFALLVVILCLAIIGKACLEEFMK